MRRRRGARVVVVCLLAVVLGGCGGSLPRDEELVENFEAHRAGFDSLIVLLEQDSTLTFLPVVIHVPDRRQSFTPEQVRRREDLQRRMARLGLWGLAKRDLSPEWMDFPVRDDWRGRRKSYAYIVDAPACMEPVASLDAVSVEMWSYRHLDGPWYVWLNLGD